MSSGDSKRYLSPSIDGAQEAHVPARRSENATAEFNTRDSSSATVDVVGQHLDDEPSYVDVTIHLDVGKVNLTLPPTTARALAADLDYAARAAEDPAEVADE
jgi:hypothetical protein